MTHALLLLALSAPAPFLNPEPGPAWSPLGAWNDAGEPGNRMPTVVFYRDGTVEVIGYEHNPHREPGLTREYWRGTWDRRVRTSGPNGTGCWYYSATLQDGPNGQKLEVEITALNERAKSWNGQDELRMHPRGGSSPGKGWPWRLYESSRRKGN